MEKRRYRVPGLQCEYCAKAVTARVGQVPGVGLIGANLGTGSLLVTGYFYDDWAIRAAIDAVVCRPEHQSCP